MKLCCATQRRFRFDAMTVVVFGLGTPMSATAPATETEYSSHRNPLSALATQILTYRRVSHSERRMLTTAETLAATVETWEVTDFDPRSTQGNFNERKCT